MSSNTNTSIVVAGAAALAATVALGFTLLSQGRVVHGSGSKLLQDFQLTRVLKVSEREVSLLGTFRTDREQRPAVVTIQKTPLDERSLPQLLESLSLHTILKNDIYSTYVGDVSRNVKPFKINVIFPATETHVLKHTDQNFHIVAETKELYEQVTLPFIESIPAHKIEWVYNILEHKTESERIVFEDAHPENGFVLLPDFKWSDTTNLDSIYCLAIVNDRSIRSLRDLRGSHLPLLKNVRDASLQALHDQFGAKASAMRVYVHYQPTYYHFHVHFSHVKITDGTQTGKAVLLEEIIYNLSRDAAYYEHATLTCAIGEMQHKPLYERFVEHGVL